MDTTPNIFYDIPSKNIFKRLKSFIGFKESLEFEKKLTKKGAKTEIYKVVKDKKEIGEVRWSSRMRGYDFQPTKDSEKEIKDFTQNLMKKWRLKRKKKK